VDAFLAADLRFHIQVLHASGNPFFAPVANVVSSALLSSLRVTNRKPADNATSVPVHQRVLKAIRAREPAKAEAAMKALLSDAAARIQRNVKRSGVMQGRPSK
jgi:DNA-binding FadR family transcriptional regulator